MDITGVLLTCVVSTLILMFFEAEEYGHKVVSPIVKKHLHPALVQKPPGSGDGVTAGVGGDGVSGSGNQGHHFLNVTGSMRGINRLLRSV